MSEIDCSKCPAVDVHYYCTACRGWFCETCYGNGVMEDWCQPCDDNVQATIHAEEKPQPTYENHPKDAGWPDEIVTALQQQVVSGNKPGTPVPTKNDNIRELVVMLANDVIDHFNTSTLSERLGTVFTLTCACMCLVPLAIAASGKKIENIKAEREEAIPGWKLLPRPPRDEQTSHPA